MKITTEQLNKVLEEAFGEIWAVQFFHITPYTDKIVAHYYNNEEEANKEYNRMKEALKDIPHLIVRSPIKVKYSVSLQYGSLTV